MYGQEACARAPRCTNRAYWRVGQELLCGVHSKRDASTRIALPKDPAAAEKREVAAKVFLDQVFVTSRPGGAPGALRCARMLGRGKQMPVDTQHHQELNIFPNNKHANRTDGIGMPALSPMRLGPVEHGEPGVPVALTIENYHQFAKVFHNEVDKRNNPLPLWYTRRDEAYRDHVPHRHKFSRGMATFDGNMNIPLYAIHLTRQGDVRRFNYVESRFFYCVAYERLATATVEYATLRHYREEQGISLCICGYDGFPLRDATDDEAIYADYCDDRVPFGHERVLLCLLRVGREMPWRRYAREHPAVYEDTCHL